jgi:hypothetical protein
MQDSGGDGVGSLRYLTGRSTATGGRLKQAQRRTTLMPVPPETWCSGHQ